MPVTRSAVSQHMRILQEVGLVRHRNPGTRHIYYIDPEGMKKLRAYPESMWEKTFKICRRAEKPQEGRRKRGAAFEVFTEQHRE